MPSSKIPLRIRLAYSVGHFQNDLMASMWFSYLLIYLHQVKNFNNIYAGTLLLVGQVADAIATPLIGYEADATSGCCGYTKRKSWHAFGLICTTCSFPFIFAPVFGATSATPDYALFVYYAAFVVIFQIGWASVQISHLSLIPELTSDESEVAGLNGWRYAATGVANLSTYAIAWVILSSGKSSVNSDSLTAADADSFRNLGFSVTALGLVASIIFHIGVREPKRGEREYNPADRGYGTIRPNDPDALADTIEQSTVEKSRRRSIGAWLSDQRFYRVALIYMSTRLFVNISQVYLPMYLTETIKLDKITIAIVPLVCYASSFLTATVLKIVDKQLGRLLTYFMGLVFALGVSVFVYFIHAHKIWMVYVAAVMIGIGGALMLVTSLSFVADLIGDFTDGVLAHWRSIRATPHQSGPSQDGDPRSMPQSPCMIPMCQSGPEVHEYGSSAFVYGAMSFTDKLANGATVEIVQIFHPCVNCCPACVPYYREVQSFVPGGAAVLALMCLGTLARWSISTRSTGTHLMRNANAVENKPANGYVPNDPVVSEDGTAGSESPLHTCCDFSRTVQTVAEVYHDSANSLNNGIICAVSDSDEDSEDAPLLSCKKSGRSSSEGSPVTQQR